MIKHLLAAFCSLVLAVACSPAGRHDVTAQTGSTPAESAAPAPQAQSAGGGMPNEIRFASSVGEVVFLHQKHITERSLDCVQCHHQINAKKLTTPHADYLQSTWVNCQVCHDGSAKSVYSCSECHRTKPKHIADETLSAKVVIHKQCAKCHNVGTGKEASDRCEFCHTRKKTDVTRAAQSTTGKSLP